MEIGEEYYSHLWQFEWNQQKAVVVCVCGDTVELLSDSPETCTCGRVYWLESHVRVDWAHKGNDPEQLMG